MTKTARYDDRKNLQMLDFLGGHTSNNAKKTGTDVIDDDLQISDSDFLIKQDVFWQCNDPLLNISQDMGSNDSLDESTQDLFSVFFNSINKDDTSIADLTPSTSDVNNSNEAVDLQDNRSSTSEDSADSITSIDESYTPTSKSRPSKGSSRRKIDPVYSNDPYLQRHRLMVNARQKNRMLKLNNMYTLLNDLIPSSTPCEKNVKPQSKLGILRRAIRYWSSLKETLTAETSQSVTDVTPASNLASCAPSEILIINHFESDISIDESEKR